MTRLPGASWAAGFPSAPFHFDSLNGLLSARAKGQAALHRPLKHPFPIAMCSGGITRSASGAGWGVPASPAPGAAEKDELGARTPGEVGPPARVAPRASASRPGPARPGASASRTRKPRRSRVGGERGRSPLAAIFFRLRAKSANLAPASCDFQPPCSILKRPTWISPQTRLGHFRRPGPKDRDFVANRRATGRFLRGKRVPAASL